LFNKDHTEMEVLEEMTKYDKSRFKFNFSISNMQPLILFFTVAYLLLSISILSGCQRQENATPYKVVDTGMWTSENEGGKLWWLDNERVLFPSNKNLKPGGGPNIMMIWNVSTGQVVPTTLDSVLCVRAGRIIRCKRDKSTDVVTCYRGTLDSMNECPPPGPDMRMDKIYDCDWIPRYSRANIPYRIKLMGDNYLEVIESKPDEGGVPRESGLKRPGEKSSRVEKKTEGGGIYENTVLYHEHPGSKPVAMPFKLGGWNGYGVKYVEWRKAYLVHPDQYYIDKHIRLWWLEVNGAVHEIPLPEKYPFTAAGGIDFTPVKAGIFVRYNGGSLSGSDGGYLIQENKVERILKSVAHEHTVSPDGCRVVFVHARNTEEYYSREKPYRTLKIINFCKGRG